MYYLFIKDEKINGGGQCPIVSEDVENVEVEEEIFNKYAETPNYYIYQDSEIVVNPNYEEEEKQKEIERVGNLTMTALDFITFLRQKGISLETINNYIDSNLEIKTQLTYCQNVYCKVACMFLPVTLDSIEITKEEAIFAFKDKNNEN